MSLAACSGGTNSSILAGQPRATQNCTIELSAARSVKSVRSTKDDCDDDGGDGGDGDTGFVDPQVAMGLDDPELGMGSIEATLPSGSTQNPDGTYTAPDGTQWSCDSNDNCLQIIGGSSTTSHQPLPVVVAYGYSPGTSNIGQLPKLIVAIPPKSGAPCPQTNSGASLGANMPINQSKATIINIYYIYEPTTFVSNPGAVGGVTPGGYTIVGYVYVNTAGQYFIQSTGADGSFFANLAAATPLGAAINNTQSGITPPLTGQQMNQFFKDYPINGSGKGTGYCFSRPLPV
jgi:hypothetical protein